MQWTNPIIITVIKRKCPASAKHGKHAASAEGGKTCNWQNVQLMTSAGKHANGANCAKIDQKQKPNQLKDSDKKFHKIEKSVITRVNLPPSVCVKSVLLINPRHPVLAYCTPISPAGPVVSRALNRSSVCESSPVMK